MTEGCPMEQSPSSSKRWWERLLIRLNVRTMMVFVLLFGLWLGWHIHSAKVQHDAVVVVQGGGHTVWYDWQWIGGRPSPAATPWWSSWLVDALGGDFFGNVVVVVGSNGPTDLQME